MKEGTLVNATIIAAPSSTKNARKERDPQMHQTKKGHPWHFGRKAYIGVNAPSGLVHRVTGTAANVADIAQTHALLHGGEKATDADADAGYLGVEKREEIATGHAGVAWHVAARRGQIQAMAEGLAREMAQQVERLQAQVRARGWSTPFISSRTSSLHRKTRYPGPAKNTAQMHEPLRPGNLFIARRSLRSPAGT
jgi:IS5 family transposase